MTVWQSVGRVRWGWFLLSAAALVLLTAIMILNFGVRAIAGKRLVSASHAQ